MATLNFVEIKNPFGSFEINPQAYTLWVPLLFLVTRVSLELTPVS